MRVGFLTTVDNALAQNQAQTQRLSVAQQQAAAGQQLLQPSDNPVAAAELLDNQAQAQRLSAYQANIASAQNALNAGSSALTSINNLLTQARQIAQEASQTSNDAATMQSYATQVDSISKQLLALANSKNGNQYIFGGTATQAQPFTQDPVTGAVHYSGSDASTDVPVGPGQTVATTVPGQSVFQLQPSGPAAASDVFQVLQDLHDNILNTQSLPPAQQSSAIAGAMSQLDQVSGNVLRVSARQGADLQMLSALSSRIQSTQTQLQQRAGQLEGNDMSAIIVNLQTQQNLLQLTQYATVHLFDQSLLNFLR